MEILPFIMMKYLTNYTFGLLVGINFLIMRPSSVIQSMLYLSTRQINRQIFVNFFFTNVVLCFQLIMTVIVLVLLICFKENNLSVIVV